MIGHFPRPPPSLHIPRQARGWDDLRKTRKKNRDCRRAVPAARNGSRSGADVPRRLPSHLRHLRSSPGRGWSRVRVCKEKRDSERPAAARSAERLRASHSGQLSHRERSSSRRTERRVRRRRSSELWPRRCLLHPGAEPGTAPGGRRAVAASSGR